MTTLGDLDNERSRVEAAYAAAAEVWRQAQATYKTALQSITDRRKPLLAAKIEQIEQELSALRVEQANGAAFPCSHCTFVATTKSGLTNHTNRMHIRPEKREKCPTCGKYFRQLKSHYATAPDCDPERREALARREARKADAETRLQAVSQVDAALSWRTCSLCGKDAHAESLSHPGVCVACAEKRNGVEVAV